MNIIVYKQIFDWKIHVSLHQTSSRYFYGYFKSIQDIHDHNTSCSSLYAIQPETELTKFSISYRSPVLWNKIISIGINPETSEAIVTKFMKKGLY